MSNLVESYNAVEEITALYVRLSKEDDLKGESYSISNQKKLLLNHAKSLNLRNIKFFIDDGKSGSNFERDGFQFMYKLMEQNKVETIIVKDSSRLGRERLELGRLTELFFPEKQIRYISVNENIDTKYGNNDFEPYMHLQNEMYIRDCSKKQKIAKKLKSSQGLFIGNTPPYGYIFNKETKKFVIDEEASKIVKKIFQLRLEGNSSYKISNYLTENKILSTSVYKHEKGIKKSKKIPINKYVWKVTTVVKILKNRAYIGDVINFKSYGISYKVKKRYKNPVEKWEIHKNAHEPIIDYSDFENVRISFETTKYRPTKNHGKNMFAGLVKCKSCNKSMHYSASMKWGKYYYKFLCKNKFKKIFTDNELCNNKASIRTEKLTNIVKTNILNLFKFIKNYKEEFLKIISNKSTENIISQMSKNKKQLEDAICRNNEIDTLFEKIYEDKALGNLDEQRFLKISKKYDDEQIILKERIKKLENLINEFKEQESNKDNFLKLIDKNKEKFNFDTELDFVLLHELIDEIIVHPRDKINKKSEQKVEIFYKFIGDVDIPKNLILN